MNFFGIAAEHPGRANVESASITSMRDAATFAEGQGEYSARGGLMKKLLVLAAAGLLSVSAYAGDASRSEANASSAGSFTSLDRNGDGQISKAEAQADKGMWNSFGKLDANGDG